MGERIPGSEGANWKAPETKDTALDTVRDRIAGIVNESRLPNEDYQSTVGVYGGKLKTENGKMIFDMTGAISKADKAGDAVLRSFDDHIAKEPLKIILKHPKWLFKFLRPGTKRYRGSPEEIFEHIKELGLENYYGLDEKGIEIKNPDIYKHGIALQDIFRQDQVTSDELQAIDRFQALEEAGRYLSSLHQRTGIGEVLSNDILFQAAEEGKVGNPVLNVPDIVYNKEKTIGEKEKKATDLLDFLMNVGVEELRRSNDWASVKTAIEKVVDNYTDPSVLGMVSSLIKRGRLTLQGDSELLNLPNNLTQKVRSIFTKHNEARINPRRGTESLLKDLVEKICNESKKTTDDIGAFEIVPGGQK